MIKEQDITFATLLEAIQGLNAKMDRMENRLVEQVVEMKEEVTTVKEELTKIKQSRDPNLLQELLFQTSTHES